MFKPNSVLTIVAIASLLLAAVSVQARQANAGPCNPAFGINNLNAAEKAEFNRNGIVRHDDPVGDYFVSYLLAAAPFDVELAMGIYASCGEHAGEEGLGDFITASDMKSPEGSNPFQVYYEQAGSWGFSGGEYTVENTVSTINSGGYALVTRLVSSSDAHFSPKNADGYVKMVPDGANKVFVTACNYMEPKSPPIFSKGKFNSMAKERLSLVGKNLMKWVSRVSQDSSKAQSYRDKLHHLVSNFAVRVIPYRVAK